MELNLYKKILNDKGSEKKGTTNLPLSDYLINDSEEFVTYISSNFIVGNLLFSGRVKGGIPKGKISMISAPSMLGKSLIALSIIKTAQKEGMDVVIIDTERAFSFNTAKSIGVDVSPEKLIVLQENSIEEVKNIILKIVEGIPRTERANILFVIDSWGTLVSSKSIDDGLEGKDVKDMTLSQKKNELANIILNTKSTYFVVNHVYDNTGGFGDPLQIPGGRRIMFNSDSVVLCSSRAKDKDKDKTITGSIISSQTFKSRHSREKIELQFRIKYDGGLDVFFGLKEDALEGGFIEPGRVIDDKETKKKGEPVYKNKPGTFMRTHLKDDILIKEDEMYTIDFWMPIFKSTSFKDYLEKKYTFQDSFDISVNEKELQEI